MNIPSQVWIPLAGVTAALIAGVVSLVNLLIAKDQKITEFRQAWIDSVRQEIATLVSLSTAISSLRHVLDTQQNKHETRDQALTSMASLLKEENARRSECKNRILMLLNRKDDVNLISKVNELCKISSISSKEEHAKIVDMSDQLVGDAQHLLKTEWTRVKRGEPFYRWIKSIIIIAVVILIMVFGFSIKQFSPGNTEAWYSVIPNRMYLSGIDNKAKPGAGERIAFSVSPDVFNLIAEIPPPTVSGVVGKAKFLKVNSDPLTDKVLLGYVIDITMDPTDLRYVADKYKHEKVVDGVSTSALENAVYSVSFEFDLLDKDGFVLERLKSPTAQAQAGRATKIQDKVQSPIPADVALGTVSVSYYLTVDKNLSIEK